MLTIAKLGVGQENYYLSTVAQGVEDYYTGGGESPGEWRGAGAARLGLAGEVASDDLAAVLSGVHPTTGEQLAGRKGSKRVPGWDLTFSAPKSVSVLYALVGAEVGAQVVEAHQAAVGEALGYLEQHATVSRRRIDGAITPVRGEGLVVAAFAHRTSRAGDPQLHTHALAANVVEHIDGGWGAVHSPVIFQHARTAGFVYQAVLRGELTERLGVEWGEIDNGYGQIDGLDEDLLDLFSKRRDEIAEAMAEAGEDSARAAQVAAHRTRAAKETGVAAESLYERWSNEAADAGFGPEVITAVLNRSDSVEMPTEAELDAIVDEMVSSRGLCESNATFGVADVMRRWCESLPTGLAVSDADLEALTRRVLADERVIPVVDDIHRLDPAQVATAEDGGVATAVAVRQRWTTIEMLAVEADLIERAATTQGIGAGQVESDIVEAYLAGREDLGEDQVAMVRRLVTSGNGLDLVVGQAGTGKTYALAAATALWRAQGYRPVGVALAARAAAELQAGAGLDSGTIAQFLIDVEGGGGLTERSIVVVDEAGMVDTRRLDRLVRHAERAGAKVVLVGDHHQLPSVEAGGAFGGLVARHGAVGLTENRRQREEWERDTLARLRNPGSHQDLAEIVDTYNQRGRLHIGATSVEVRAGMARDWFEAHQAGESVAMVALRRSDVDELNCRARALLVEAGLVDAEGLEVGERTFGIGDRVVCLRNDRRLGVHNGLFGQVAAVGDDELLIAIEGDRQLTVPHSYIAEGLDHGYATTLHKAQGSTVDRLLMLGDDRIYRQAGYVGLSRGRHRNDMYLVNVDDRDLDDTMDTHGIDQDQDAPVDRLVRSLARDGAKTLASDGEDLGAEHANRASLADLWAARDALADELGPEPVNHSGELAQVIETEQATLKRLEVATERRMALESGGGRDKISRRDLQHAIDHQQHLVEQAAASAGERTELEASEDARHQWERKHRVELGQLRQLDDEIAHREELAGSAAEVQRPGYITSVIGEPPIDAAGRHRWRAEASAIESSRARSGSEPPTLDLRAEPEHPESLDPVDLTPADLAV